MNTFALPAYPMVNPTDHPPTNQAYSYPDTFDKTYLSDLYTNLPDPSLDAFLNCETLFDRPVNSVEFSAGYPGPDTSTSPNAYRPAFKPAPFGQLEQGFGSSFPFDMQSTSGPKPPLSPRTTFPTSEVNSANRIASPTRSPGTDAAVPALPTASPLSPSSLKRESPDDPTSTSEDPPPKRVQRKRGRPRLDRTLPSMSSSPRQTQQNRSNRLPHNQVERKYREGLNSELERLRRAVPTLPQSDEGALMGQPKPSKAMVLSGAIEYIRAMEREREVLLEENEKLGGAAWRAAKGGEPRPNGKRLDPTPEWLDDCIDDDERVK